MEKKTASIIGVVLGIAIIIIGICVMNPETYTVGDPLIKFGADFYTEMYDVTRDVGGAVQRAYKNICNAIGWLIVAIGLFDVAYFVYKMVSSEQDDYYGYTVTPSIATSTTSPSVQSNTYSVTQDSVRPAAADEWKCTCGKIHKDYETSCVCGVTKISTAKQAERQNAWDHWNEEHSSIGQCEICGTKDQFLVFAEFQENDQTLQKNLCFECFSQRDCKPVTRK